MQRRREEPEKRPTAHRALVCDALASIRAVPPPAYRHTLGDLDTAVLMGGAGPDVAWPRLGNPSTDQLVADIVREQWTAETGICRASPAVLRSRPIG